MVHQGLLPHSGNSLFVHIAFPQMRVLFRVVLPTKGTVFANACHEGFDFLPVTIFGVPRDSGETTVRQCVVKSCFYFLTNFLTSMR